MKKSFPTKQKRGSGLETLKKKIKILGTAKQDKSKKSLGKRDEKKNNKKI